MTPFPIHVAIRFPTRIRVECTTDTPIGRDRTTLYFDGSDGSRLMIVLSDEQVRALMGLQSNDPVKVSRDLYVTGHIDIAEFEHRLDGVLLNVD